MRGLTADLRRGDDTRSGFVGEITTGTPSGTTGFVAQVDATGPLVFGFSFIAIPLTESPWASMQARMPILVEEW